MRRENLNLEISAREPFSVSFSGKLDVWGEVFEICEERSVLFI